MKLIIVNNRLIGTFSDGSPIMLDLTGDQLSEVMSNWQTIDESWIRAKFYPELERVIQLKSNLSAIEKTGSFEYRDGSLYMKGIDLTIPRLLAKELAVSIETERFEALKKFWILCSLNPNPQARQDLFAFLEKSNFAITSSGLFVAYRNVAIKNAGQNRKLAEFVNSCIPKVKAWKKSAKNFDVFQSNEGDYVIIDTKKRKTSPEEQLVGNLKELLETMTDEVIYTDNHTKTFTIKIGKPVSMPREQCDSNAGIDCSTGLHLGNRVFLSRGSFGQVGLVCLCNPYNVVSVPSYDTNKLRCCEYLPIGIAEYDSSGKLIELDTKLYEDSYCQFTVEQINEMLNASSPEDVQINTLFEVGNVKNIRETANKSISGRNIYYGQ